MPSTMPAIVRSGVRSVAAPRQDLRNLSRTVVPFGEPEWQRAVDAFRTYGRGRHKAGLNFGDCLAYATAASAADTLLYFGDDFTHTDLPAI